MPPTTKRSGSKQRTVFANLWVRGSPAPPREMAGREARKEGRKKERKEGSSGREDERRMKRQVCFTLCFMPVDDGNAFSDLSSTVACRFTGWAGSQCFY